MHKDRHELVFLILKITAAVFVFAGLVLLFIPSSATLISFSLVGSALIVVALFLLFIAYTPEIRKSLIKTNKEINKKQD